MAQRSTAKLRMVDRVGELGLRVFAMVGRGAMEPAGLPGNSCPGVCGRHTGAVGYATAHQVDRAAGLVAGKEQEVSDKKPTVAALQRKIERLEAQVEQLKAAHHQSMRHYGDMLAESVDWQMRNQQAVRLLQGEDV